MSRRLVLSLGEPVLLLKLLQFSLFFLIFFHFAQLWQGAGSHHCSVESFISGDGEGAAPFGVALADPPGVPLHRGVATATVTGPWESWGAGAPLWSSPTIACSASCDSDRSGSLLPE